MSASPLQMCCGLSVEGSAVNANQHVYQFFFLVTCSDPCFMCLFGLRRACSLVATLFEGQWSALPTSAHSRRDGSLTGRGTDSVCCGVSRTSVVVSRANTTPVQLRDLTNDRTTERPNERTNEPTNQQTTTTTTTTSTTTTPRAVLTCRGRRWWNTCSTTPVAGARVL